jgi:hypothetical protein
MYDGPVRAVVALVFVLGGCTQLLDLHAVESSDVDLDGDGIRDDRDNCKGVPNPDQADRDGDGVGDACDPLDSVCAPGLARNRDYDLDTIDDGCDPCPRGPNVDEDGDGVFDACDTCPATPDDQSDGDGDSVGDACDPSTSTNRRVFFDGFSHPERSRWVPASWTVAGGVATASARSPQSSVNNAAVFGSGWNVQLAVELPPLADAQANDRIGIVLRTLDDRRQGWCVLIADPANGTYVLGIATAAGGMTTVVAAPGAAPGAIATLIASAAGGVFRCSLGTGEAATAGFLPEPFKVRVHLGIATARLRYVDVVR